MEFPPDDESVPGAGGLLLRVKCRRPLRVEWLAVALCPRSIKRTGILVFSAIRDGNLGSVRFSATLQARLIGHDAAELAQPAVSAPDGEVGTFNRSSRLVRPCRVARSVEVALLRGADSPRAAGAAPETRSSLRRIL